MINYLQQLIIPNTTNKFKFITNPNYNHLIKINIWFLLVPLHQFIDLCLYRVGLTHTFINVLFFIYFLCTVLVRRTLILIKIYFIVLA